MTYSIKKTARGYVALISVLITSAILLVVGIGASMRGIDAADLALATSLSGKALALADSCGEEGLLKLKANLSYSGNETIMIGGSDSCTILSVTGSGNLNRLLLSEALVGGYVRRIRIDVAQVNPTLILRSWREAE